VVSSTCKNHRGAYNWGTLVPETEDVAGGEEVYEKDLEAEEEVRAENVV
jgi:hypothetical protein